MAGPTREWVTLPDPKDDQRTWQFDVTFLMSHWQCIFGDGCQGVLTEPVPELVQGCCSYGAHFSDADDQKRVEKAAKKLTADEWQFRKKGRKKGIAVKVGKKEYRTRLVDGACVFLNRPGFGNGPGCALHQHSMRTGTHFMAMKPDVCWQLPLRRIDRDEDDGTITSVFTEFGREGWGEGGDDFCWWCTEAPEAFTASEPVYKTLGAEIEGMVGKKLYRQLLAYLETHEHASPPPLLHPAESPVTLLPTRNG
ncbi:MAG: hypothetical protein JWL73_133 [Actinomycetia bacterium]|nr:hypothetical protein [Actinomycetes bacterium]